MKIFCMSDIHGCLKNFEDALSLIDLNGENMLILLGDYIDGGKDALRGGVIGSHTRFWFSRVSMGVQVPPP